MTASLLPPNATPLELAVEAATALDERITDLDTISGLKTRVPEALIPWLLWEYGLVPLTPYLTDPRRAIAEGIVWQRIRGTPKALTTALGWVGCEDARIEETGPGFGWSRIQIDPGLVPSRDQARGVIAVSGLSLPARSRLARLYHDLDLRALRLDRDTLDRALLDDWSGIDLDGARQSYRTRHATTFVRPATDPRAGLTIAHGSRVHRDRAWRLDIGHLDSPREPRLVTGALVSVQSIAFVRPRPPVPTPHRWTLPASAMRDGTPLDGPLHVLDGYAEVDDDARAGRIDDGLRLDGPVTWRWRAIDRFTLAPTGAVFPGRRPALRAAARKEAHGHRLDRRSRPTVLDLPPDDRRSRFGLVDPMGAAFPTPDTPWGDGPWTDRPWGTYTGGFAHQEVV